MQINAVTKEYTKLRAFQMALGLATSGPPNSWRSWVDLSCVNDRCINTRFKAWWCTRQSSDIFITSLTSSRSWAEASLSALSWDWRSRTDWGSDCIEVVSHLLVSSFNSLSSSRQDLGVISLSSRWFGSLSSLKFCLAEEIRLWKRNKETCNRFHNYISK